jgi:hypothetical protein
MAPVLVQVASLAGLFLRKSHAQERAYYNNSGKENDKR